MYVLCALKSEAKCRKCCFFCKRLEEKPAFAF